MYDIHKKRINKSFYIFGLNPHGGILFSPVAVPKSVPDFITTKSPTRKGSVQSFNKHIFKSC